MMRRFLSIVIALAALVAATAAPAMAASNAQVTTTCVERGTVTLPPGPPPAENSVSVTVNGRLVTTHNVPGPCGAPGWVKTHVP